MLAGGEEKEERGKTSRGGRQKPKPADRIQKLKENNGTARIRKDKEGQGSLY